MSRRRPFAVEMVRRERVRSSADVWRWLAAAALLQARRANGEVFGPSPDRGGAERWSMMQFGLEVAHAPPAPFVEADEAAIAMARGFRTTVAAFVRAGEEGDRRILAPVLAAQAEALSALMDRAGVEDGRYREERA
jgi:hypothetical protein